MAGSRVNSVRKPKRVSIDGLDRRAGEPARNKGLMPHKLRMDATIMLMTSMIEECAPTRETRIHSPDASVDSARSLQR